VTANLTVSPAISSTQSMTICTGENLIVGSNTYSTTGVYTDVLTNVNGCDSTVTTTLTVSPPISSIQTMTICTGENLIVGSNTYTTTGVYTDVLMNVNGCDSTVTTALTVSPAISSTQSMTICIGENLIVGSNTYTTPGVYTDVLTDVNGCDSTVTTNLTVNQPNINVTQNNAELTAETLGAVYQWLDCDNNYSPIIGETLQTYSVTTNGIYALRITENGCTDTSICITIENVEITENAFDLIKIYPNPTHGNVTVVNHTKNELIIRLFDLSGREIYSLNTVKNTQTINMAQLSEGTYLLKVEGDNISKTYKLLKE
jgi:hypothetical protein